MMSSARADADPDGRAVYGVSLRALVCWDIEGSNFFGNMECLFC